MAQVSGALCLSHSPYLYTPPRNSGPKHWQKSFSGKTFPGNLTNLLSQL